MVNLDSNQLERLKAIGAYLYEVRQEQARTLEEIAAKTYIPLRILKALEAGQENILPEPVFVQGFIRRYADVLGLDGTGISQEFPVQSMIDPEISTNGSLEDAVLPPPVQSDVPLSEGFSLRRSSSPSFLPYLAAGALAVVALGGLLYGLSQRNSSPQSQTTAEQPPSPAPETQPNPAPIAESPAPSPSPTTPAASPTPSPTAPVTVSINLTDASWLEVSVDGNIEFEGTLNRGEQRSWTAQQAITIYSGNPGAVMVTHNQQQATAMGQPGIPEERTYTASAAPTPSTP
ncbi:helix-turn-helix domain-containing protein [Egbenema bharatensis]|uniref:helix-turn-helix domain-containing protein n=1 Tax=Egbenema bharatensis TaxID=3463334 RepID=UPI003A85A96D